MSDIIDLTTDEQYFGRAVWIYCNQHLRPHLTGWCTVSNRNKTKLDAMSSEAAYEECAAKDMKIYRG